MKEKQTLFVLSKLLQLSELQRSKVLGHFGILLPLTVRKCMLTQRSVFQGCAEMLPPPFIFQEETVRVILIHLGREWGGRWQAEKSEKSEVERCSAGDVPKQEA